MKQIDNNELNNINGGNIDPRIQPSKINPKTLLGNQNPEDHNLPPSPKGSNPADIVRKISKAFQELDD